MKTVILINARLGSTRLQQKHLLLVDGKPILQFLIDSINREFREEITAGNILTAIATSVVPINKTFEKTIKTCQVFYGSDENIPLRQLQAADYFEADKIISVDGDDILCSTAALRRVYDNLINGDILVKTEGLPLGMNASGYATGYLRKRVELLGTTVCETGWGRVFEPSDYTTLKIDSLNDEFLRFTLDYQEDFDFFKELLIKPEISGGIWGDANIIEYVLENKLQEITRPRVEEYWQNFHNQRKNEELGK